MACVQTVSSHQHAFVLQEARQCKITISSGLCSWTLLICSTAITEEGQSDILEGNLENHLSCSAASTMHQTMQMRPLNHAASAPRIPATQMHSSKAHTFLTLSILCIVSSIRFQRTGLRGRQTYLVL